MGDLYAATPVISWPRLRLSTCIAIELGVGSSALVALAAGGLWLATELGHGKVAEARVAPPLAAPVDARSSVPRIEPGRPEPAPVEVAAPPRPGEGRFVGQPDAALLAPIKSGQIAEVKFNRGGSSISLRIDFDNGARAAFKPNQTNMQTVPRREVAAYRISRLLGLEVVSPAVGRRFSLEDIRAHLRADMVGRWPRFMAEGKHDGVTIDGQLSFWIPNIEDAKIEGLLIDSTDGILAWKSRLTIGEAIPAEDLRLVAQISDMVVFDYVINNSDRWSGNNTKMSPDGTLYFMDNALSFGADRRGHSRVRTYFERSQKFSRRLIDALRRLDEPSIRAALAWDVEPFPFLLDDGEIAALLARRHALLASLDRLIAQHGEDKVMVFP